MLKHLVASHLTPRLSPGLCRARDYRQNLLSTTALTTGRLSLVLILLNFVWLPDVEANPKGGQVVGGTAKIVQTSPKRLDIRQTSDKAIINWQSFSIAKGEHTKFHQPSKSSVALNRVIGGDLSTIAGRLSANGNLILINPNGVLFTKSAQVDVHGLIASTSDIADRDFMAGRFDFSAASDPSSFVINRGSISAAEGGLVALVAPWVENSGVIAARLGRVELASGGTFTVDLYGDRLIQLAVPEAGDGAGIIPAALSDPARVSNTGTISADGSVVAMSVADAQQIVSNVINMDGVIEARSVQQVAGRILLNGGNTGIVSVSGTLDASGRDAGEAGGQVAVLGEKVGLFDGAVVDVSGDLGGGKALIGGNFQGAGPEANAKATYVAEGARIHADALQEGNGGTAIVWADEGTRFEGKVTARGGSDGGDGGFVEVSGKENLAFWGNVDVSAPAGESGTLLLDPNNVTIDNTEGDTNIDPEADPFSTVGDNAILSVSSLKDALANGDVIVQTSATEGSLEDGNITILTSFVAPQPGDSPDEGSSLTLMAQQNIVFEGSGSIDFSGNSGTLSLQADAASDGIGAIVNNSSAASAIVLGDGGLELLAGNGIGTQGAPITIEENGTIAAKTTDGGIFITSKDDLIIGTVGISDEVPGDFTDGLMAGGDIFVDAMNLAIVRDISATEGVVQLSADSTLMLGAVDEPLPLDIFAGDNFLASGTTVIKTDVSIKTDGADIRFTDNISGEHQLKLSAGDNFPRGTVTLQGNVSVGDFETAAATNNLEGESYSVAGDLLIAGDTVLRKGSSVELSVGNALFIGAIDGEASLKIVSMARTDPGGQTLGRVSISDDVGRTSALTGFDVTAEEIFVNDVITQGRQAYNSINDVRLQGTYDTGGNAFTVNGPAVLADTTIITSGANISFEDTVNGSSINPDLTLVSGAGTVEFKKQVGTNVRLGKVDAAGSRSLSFGQGAGARQLIDNFTRVNDDPLPADFRVRQLLPEFIAPPTLIRDPDPNTTNPRRRTPDYSRPARLVDASPVAEAQNPLLALASLETLSEVAPGAGPESASESIVITESDAEAIEEALDVIVETCPDVVLTSLAWQNTPADAAFSLKPTVVPYSVDEYCAGYLMTYPGRGASGAYQGLSFITQDFWTDLEQSRDAKVVPEMLPSFGLEEGAPEKLQD